MASIIDETQMRKNLRYCSLDGLLGTPWLLFTLPVSFIAAGMLNQLFQIGPFWFGVVASMPAVANAIHIIAIPFVSKYMKVRDMMLSFGWLNLGAWFSGAVGIAFIPLDEPNVAGLFFAILYAFISFSSSLMGIAWTAWVGDFVPGRVRGRYMAFRNRLSSIATIVFMVTSVAVFHFFGASREVYLILIIISLILRTISLMIKHLIISPDPSGGTVTQAKWTTELSKIRKELKLLRFIAFGAVSGFFLAFSGTLAAVYSFDYLQVSAAEFTGFSLSATVSAALFLPLWGRLIDKHGAIPIVVITFFLWRLNDVGWLFVTPETANWLNVIWFTGGAMGAGFLLATFTLLLKLIPRTSRGAGISINLTLTSIAGAIAPIIAGQWVNVASTDPESLKMNYTVMFIFAIGGALLSTAILFRMKEPDTDPSRNTVASAMRTLGQQVLSNGVGLFYDRVFFRRRRKRKGM